MVETDVVVGRVAERLAERQVQVGPSLEAYLRSPEPVPEPLAEAMRYSVCGPGKRLRPALVLAGCELCGGQVADALPAAVAIEYVHAFSLVHDDLPCMDDDDLRRGRPTTHKVFGEAVALLAGDALLTLAFGVLVDGYGPTALSGQMCGVLHEATGWRGMIGGQVADLLGEAQAPQRDLVDYIHRHKTGCLIECACRMGALAAKADDHAVAAMGRYGEHLGLAFQITDDLLDVTGTAEDVGKRTGKDAEAGKQTYPQVMGIEASRQVAREQVDLAVAAVSPFGASAAELVDLAKYVLERSM